MDYSVGVAIDRMHGNQGGEVIAYFARIHSRGVTGDNPLILHALDALNDRGRRQIDLVGQLPERNSSVFLQLIKYLPIQAVQFLLLVINHYDTSLVNF